MAKNIVDKPRQSEEDDLLGIDKYTNALVKYIDGCKMPVTLAIQGEWGSGKTSLINQIRYRLCEGDTASDKPFYGVWLNTWQYSLMKSKDETLIAIMAGLTKKIVEILKRKHESKTQAAISKVTGIFGKIAKAGAKVAMNTAGLDGGALDDIDFSSGSQDSDLLDLKRELENSVKQCLKEDHAKGDMKRGFIFFIDDLDRIDPPVAVEILELVKNIFEVDNCIFVLAIDYEVVVKGLVPKFGPLTEKNEREFRSFFDKIIQLPFSMPISSYDVTTFLIQSLEETGYITNNQNRNNEFSELLAQLVLLSVGTNPRSLKRLINTISLLQILDEENNAELNRPDFEKLLNFGFVCIQIAFPFIYNTLLQEPNFKGWDDNLAKKLRLKPLSDDQKELLASHDEFDEQWEQVLYKICQSDYFLSSRVYQISQLLNLLATFVPKDEDLGEVVTSILNLSSVTSVNLDQFGKGSKKIGSRVRFDGLEGTLQTLAEKGSHKSTINALKELHDTLSIRFGDLMTFKYMPEGFTTNLVGERIIKGKGINIIRVRNKSIRIEFNYRKFESPEGIVVKAVPYCMIYTYNSVEGKISVVEKDQPYGDGRSITVSEFELTPEKPIETLFGYIVENYNSLSIVPYKG